MHATEEKRDEDFLPGLPISNFRFHFATAGSGQIHLTQWHGAEKTTLTSHHQEQCHIEYGVHGQQKQPSGTRTTVQSSIHVALLCNVDPIVVVPQSFQDTGRRSKPTIDLVEMGDSGFWHRRVRGQRLVTYTHHVFVVSNLTHATLVGLFWCRHWYRYHVQRS